MALRKDTATEIIKVVDQDANCRASLADPISFFKIFSPIGGAGTVRNLWYILNFKKNTDPDCIGIAEATAAAIDKAASLQAKKISRHLRFLKFGMPASLTGFIGL